jgi:hypothetical protein
MNDLKQLIKTTIRESLNEGLDDTSWNGHNEETVTQKDKTDADLSVVLKSLVRGTRILRREKEMNGDDPTKIKPTPVVNENRLADWVRKKRFGNEEEGRLILKGIEEGEATRIEVYRDRRVNGGSINHSGYDFQLAGHDINVDYWGSSTPSGHWHDSYNITVDEQYLDVSNGTIKKIMKSLHGIVNAPQQKRKLDIKNSLSRYNLSKEDRKDLEDTDKYFS